VHPYVVGNGARRLRRFDVVGQAASAKLRIVSTLTPKRPEGRAPTRRQLAIAPARKPPQKWIEKQADLN
jgi:hypothetical protein